MKAYRDLDAGADRLLDDDDGAQFTNREAVKEPTEVHRQVIALLHDLLSLVKGQDAGPFGGMLRMLQRLEPMLLRDFAEVPEEPIVEFLHQLGRRMLAVGVPTAASREAPAELAATNNGHGSQPDQSPGT